MTKRSRIVIESSSDEDDPVVVKKVNIGETQRLQKQVNELVDICDDLKKRLDQQILKHERYVERLEQKAVYLKPYGFYISKDAL